MEHPSQRRVVRTEARKYRSVHAFERGVKSAEDVPLRYGRRESICETAGCNKSADSTFRASEAALHTAVITTLQP